MRHSRPIRVIAAVAAGLLLLGAGAFLAVHYAPTPARRASPVEGPGAPTAGSSRPVGIYAFTAGVNYVLNPSGVVARLASAPFRPQGIDWVVGWRYIEPAPGQYRWSIIDNDLADSTSAGFRSIVEIIPGEDDPTWALALCPTVQVNVRTGRQVTMCVPTSQRFLSMWTSLIVAFGHRYDGRSGLTMVQATGCGVQGEMQLPNHNADFWSGYGVTTDTLLAAWERTIGAWRTAFPHTPSSLAIEEPLGRGNSDVLSPLLSWVRQHYGASVWLQQNGLRQGTSLAPGSYASDLAAASRWTTVGWQMFGQGEANGNLDVALSDGLAVHPRFLEVYLNDVLNAGNAAALRETTAGA